MLSYIRSQLSLKVSLALAAILILLTTGIASIITYRQVAVMEEMMLTKAKLAARIGAESYGNTLQEAIDNGALTVNDAFDKNYSEIKGYDWGGNPKFHTRYDTITDKAVLHFQDRFLEDEDFVFAVGVDNNGYLPTHNTKYQLPITGDAAKDLTGNRTKRMFTDPVGLAAAKNTEPTLVQVYKRDTGETMWDVSAPVYVKGKHWGGFRLGVSMVRIDARKRTLIWTLVGMFAAFGLVVTGAIFGMIKRAMGPVERLTKAADLISVGEGLETPIRPTTTDEIGRLTKSLDRLRASMQAAMSRLGE